MSVHGSRNRDKDKWKLLRAERIVSGLLKRKRCKVKPLTPGGARRQRPNLPFAPTPDPNPVTEVRGSSSYPDSERAPFRSRLAFRFSVLFEGLLRGSGSLHEGIVSFPYRFRSPRHLCVHGHTKVWDVRSVTLDPFRDLILGLWESGQEQDGCRPVPGDPP